MSQGEAITFVRPFVQISLYCPSKVYMPFVQMSPYYFSKVYMHDNACILPLSIPQQRDVKLDNRQRLAY